MCGRLAIFSPPESFSELFGVDQVIDYSPSYNIPPTLAIPTCRLDIEGHRELLTMRWGLVPHWSKGPDSRFSMFNARAETVHEKPAFRGAFRKQRCLIPADGFYEWSQANGKQPYFIHRRDNAPLVFAGLWEQWRGESDESIDSCTIIVTEANEQMQALHDRMPVILRQRQFNDWLDPENDQIDDLRDMLKPYAAGDLEIYPVSRDVNRPKNDRAGLIERVETA